MTAQLFETETSYFLNNHHEVSYCVAESKTCEFTFRADGMMTATYNECDVDLTTYQARDGSEKKVSVEGTYTVGGNMISVEVVKAEGDKHWAWTNISISEDRRKCYWITMDEYWGLYESDNGHFACHFFFFKFCFVAH